MPKRTKRLKALSLHLVTALAVAAVIVLPVAPVWGFCEEAGDLCARVPELCQTYGVPLCHDEITEEGLSFARTNLVDRAVNGNLHTDHEHFFSARHHMDGCDFNGGDQLISDVYRSNVDDEFYLGLCLPISIDCEIDFPHLGCFIDVHCDGAHFDSRGVIGLFDPNDPRPTDAAHVWGYALHPIQDIYSHSNWIEIFQSIGVTKPPLIEPSVDDWRSQPWEPMAVPAEMLEALGVDAVALAEENGYGEEWTFAGNVLNPIVTTDTGYRYAAVVTDTTAGEDECEDGMSANHAILNKDSTKMHPFYHPDPQFHYNAAEAAIRQTQQEWCRVLHLTWNRFGPAGVSVPMGFWVRPDAPSTGPGSPHPPGTQCEATPPGDVEITVDVDQIRVLNDKDGSDAGELNFVLALFTHDLTRSHRVAVGPIAAENEDVIGDNAAPGPVTLCLSGAQANAAAATVQAWDDDNGTSGDLNEGDQALRGVYIEVAQHALGTHTVASADMEVTFNVSDTPTDTDADTLTRCEEEALGTNPGVADTDDDGLPDGEEVDAGTNPLDEDTDDDQVKDGPDNCPLTANAGQEDYEADGVGDACDEDDDNDGVADGDDPFPQSDLRQTVFVGSCDTEVANDVLSDGSSFNDLVGRCADSATNHGELVSCVSLLASQWRQAGLITNQDQSAIERCAAGAR